MRETTQQAGHSGTEEKSKEGIYSGLIGGKCRAGGPHQPWKKDSRNVPWEKNTGRKGRKTGAQRATGPAKQNK